MVLQVHVELLGKVKNNLDLQANKCYNVYVTYYTGVYRIKCQVQT